MNWLRNVTRAEWAVLIGIGLLALLFFGAALLPGRVLLPTDIIVDTWPPWQPPNQADTVHNPLLTDVVNYIYPLKSFVAEQVRQGTLPLWNPYVLNGYPLTYNTQAGLFYPLSLFYTLLPGAAAVDAVIFVQLFLGGLFMWLYLRRLGLRAPAVWTGAVLFLFNGMMLVWLEWQVVHAAVIWLPLQLYCIESVAGQLQRRGAANRRLAAVGGIAFALPWLGGHWNWALYGSLTAALYLAWRWGLPALDALRRGDRATAARIAVLGGWFLGLGIGLSLVQVAPAFNYLRQGHRQPFTWAESQARGAPAIGLLVADFFGNPIHRSWWGANNYNEQTLFAGLLPLFLAALGLYAGRRRRALQFWGLWGACGLLWTLGTPFYGALWLLPVFNGLWPSRAAVVFLVALAILAAAGVDALLRGAIPARLRVRTAGGGALLCVAVVAGAWVVYRPVIPLRNELLWFALALGVAVLLLTLGYDRLPRSAWGLLVAGWIAVDLLWLGHDYNTVGRTAELYPPTETAAFLQADPEPYRIVTLIEGRAYPPNTALQDRIEMINGYEPAILETVLDYLTLAEGGSPLYFERALMLRNGVDSPLIDALNAKYVVTIGDRFLETPALAAERTPDGTQLSLPPGAALSAAFSVPDAGFFRLDLPLTGAGAGRATARVYSADGGQELANSSWDEASAAADAWAAFYFAAFPSEWGRQFQLTLTNDGPGPLAAGAAGDELAYRAYYLPRPQLVHESGKTRVYLNEGLPAARLRRGPGAAGDRPHSRAGAGRRQSGSPAGAGGRRGSRAGRGRERFRAAAGRGRRLWA